MARLSLSGPRTGIVDSVDSATGPGAPRGPKKERKYVDNANGVPWKFMKEKKLCGGFNIGSCERKADHKIGPETVHHYCAGCFGVSKGMDKKDHRAVDCPKGPFDPSLFG